MSEIHRLRPYRRPMSRRMLLRGMAGVGAAAAFGPALAACTAGSTPSPSSAGASPSPGASAAPSASPSPTPVPSPEAELNVYNYDDYIGEDTIPSFEEKYGIRVTYDTFTNYEEMTTRISTGNSGFDITFATGVDVPGFLGRTPPLVQPLDLSLIPNIVNLGAEWQNPGYDPGNQHSIPYMWWTTGFGYDTEKIADELTSWDALWDEQWKGKLGMLDDYREVFGVALIRLGYSVNTTSDAELDEALAMLEEQKPLLRKYTADEIADLKSGNLWLSHAWSGDVAQVTVEKESVVYVLPPEGSIRGSDAMVLLANAPHPIAAHLFINHMLDAEISAGNTNYIYYMGPNEAAKQFIDPAILEDPTLNPDKATLEKLQELLDLGEDLQKYQERWTTLRST